jgi:hypothetical protein
VVVYIQLLKASLSLSSGQTDIVYCFYLYSDADADADADADGNKMPIFQNKFECRRKPDGRLQ